MSDATHEIIIEAGRTESQYWRDLFRYRELFYFLAWRDVLVRYKQTVIGILWAVLRPFLTMVIFVFIFSKIAELPSEGLVTGALQVPPDGMPILLLADHPVTGGYPVIAVVASADLGLAAQLRPGQLVSFALSR